MISKGIGYLFRIFKISVLAIITAVVATGCVKDQAYSVDGTEENPLVRFSVRVPGTAVPSTRAMDVAAEAEVRTVDIILFEPESDGGGFHFHTTSNEIDMANNREGSFAVRLPVGIFDMVMIANAADQVAEAVGKLDESSTKGSLQELLTVSQAGKWETGENDYIPIPMWGEKSGQQIKEGLRITDIDLVRMLSRINVSVGPNAGFVLKEVHLVNPYSEGFVIPSAGNWKPDEHKVSDPSTLTGWAGTGTILSYGGQHIDGNGNCLNEIYTFEAPAGSASEMENNTFVIVGGYYGQDALTETISYYRIDLSLQTEKTTDYLPLLRNHRYNIYIQGIGRRGSDSIEEASDGAQVEITVSDDGDMHYFIYDEEYYLAIENRQLLITEDAGPRQIKIDTDHPEGWTAKVSGSPTDPTVAIEGDWLDLTTSAGQEGRGEIRYDVTENNTNDPRTAYFHISAGPLETVVTVTQDYVFDLGNKEDPSKMTFGYVGAFWRADQTGERLIRIHRTINGTTIGGAWTATVIKGSDWIVLDTQPTSDPGVTLDAGNEDPADMSLPANDARYQVSGNAITVSGYAEDTEDIYFRIGLKSTIPEDQNRYGLVRLKYNEHSKEQLIFIRQGHAPDYLMRPKDSNDLGESWPVTPGGDPRPQAVRWSPFNVTSADEIEFVYQQLERKNPNNMSGGGVHTDYPSQAGAFFQWANDDAPRYAWSPWRYALSSSMTDREPTSSWSLLAANHETCPPGYRRPNDGSVAVNNHGTGSATVEYSEMRQSLYLYPFRGIDGTSSFENSLVGFYADGWFDRRAIGQPSSGGNSPHSAVAIDTHYIAYRGSLLYNPYTYASLFFPAAGNRTQNGTYNQGILSNPGSYSVYWTATRNDSSHAWVFFVISGQNANNYKQSVAPYIDGASLRCIVDE